MKHLRDFGLSLEGYQNIFGLFAIHILSKLNKIFTSKNCIIEHYNLESSYDSDDCDVYFFFHFDVWVASGDCRIVIFARIRMDNRPLSHGVQGRNKKLCFCPSSLALDERLDGQNLLFQHCVIKIKVLFASPYGL